MVGVAVAPSVSAQDTPSTTEARVTTTTSPVDNSDLGRIVPRPNSGAEPQSPSDRGGWQQLTLFLLVCATIVGIAVFVWWRAGIARSKQRAAGYDRVTDARAHGGDVRAPRPPGIRD